MARKRAKKAEKVKRKSSYKIYAPKSFGEILLGETLADKPEKVLNRVVEISGAELFNQRKLSHIIAKFKVSEVKEDRALTELSGFRCDSTFLKRIVRRRRTKIDAIVDVRTKDKKRFRVTMTTIAFGKLESNKETEIRKIMESTLQGSSSKSNYEEFLRELMTGTIANKIMEKIKKYGNIQRVEAIKAKPL